MKGRQSRLDVLILTETSSVADSKLNAEIGYAVSRDTVEAWALNSTQQAKDCRTGKDGSRYIQVLSERSYRPIQVFDIEKGTKPSPVIGKNVNNISSQKEDEADAFLEARRARRNLQLYFLGGIASLLAIAIMLRVALGGGLSCSPQVPKLMMAAAAGIVTRKIWSLRRKPPAASTEKVLVYIFSDKTRKLIDRQIKPKHLPAGARSRDYHGKQLYMLNLSTKGKFYPINVPDIIEENGSPMDLFIALNCEEEVNAAYGQEMTRWEKIKYGIVACIIGAELLILFIWQSAGV